MIFHVRVYWRRGWIVTWLDDGPITLRRIKR